MTAYQLAIKLQQRHREAADALHEEVGGRGTGTHTSLAQTLGKELSRRIKDSDGTYPVEGPSSARMASRRFPTPTQMASP